MNNLPIVNPTQPEQFQGIYNKPVIGSLIHAAGLLKLASATETSLKLDNGNNSVISIKEMKPLLLPVNRDSFYRRSILFKFNLPIFFPLTEALLLGFSKTLFFVDTRSALTKMISNEIPAPLDPFDLYKLRDSVDQNHFPIDPQYHNIGLRIFPIGVTGDIQLQSFFRNNEIPNPSFLVSSTPPNLEKDEDSQVNMESIAIVLTKPHGPRKIHIVLEQLLSQTLMTPLKLEHQRRFSIQNQENNQ